MGKKKKKDEYFHKALYIFKLSLLRFLHACVCRDGVYEIKLLSDCVKYQTLNI